MREPRDPLVGNVLADRFEILERVGEGGTGVVYKATDQHTSLTVAVKVLGAEANEDPDWTMRFAREGRLAGRLSHPQIVPILESGTTPAGYRFLAMGFVRGESLRAVLERVNILPPVQALTMVVDIARSLEYVHNQDIVHRDVKPDNIMIRLDGMLMLMDFGISVDITRKKETISGKVVGTPAYMSPEQCLGLPVDARSDMYSLGILLYELVSGRTPFDSPTALETVNRQIRETASRPAGVPRSVWIIIRKMLEKNPHDRPSSCTDFKRLCEETITELEQEREKRIGLQRSNPNAITERHEFVNELLPLGLIPPPLAPQKTAALLSEPSVVVGTIPGVVTHMAVPPHLYNGGIPSRITVISPAPPAGRDWKFVLVVVISFLIGGAGTALFLEPRLRPWHEKSFVTSDRMPIGRK